MTTQFYSGENTAEARRQAAASAANAAVALAAAGVGEQPDTTTGLGATAIGDRFWVDQGDGTGKVYLHEAGPVATFTGLHFILDMTGSGAAARIGESGGGFVETLLAAALRGSPGKKIKVVAGVIRNNNDGLGWQVIDDGTSHDPLNIDSVSTNTTGITISYAGIAATRVISFLAVPDERMAQAGMTVGGSIGTGSAGLWIGALLDFWLDTTSGTPTLPPWFASGSVTVTGSGATRTITHPQISSANIPPIIGKGFNSASVLSDVATSAFTDTTFDIQCLTDLAAYVSYASSTWSVTSQIDLTAHTITPAWEASNGGQLRVTHPSVETDNVVSCITAAAGHRIFVNGVADGSFTVQFFDNTTGTQLASPVSGIGIRFRRARKCRMAAMENTRLNISRGYARIDPTLLHSGTMPNSNIWFFGIFEI